MEKRIIHLIQLTLVFLLIFVCLSALKSFGQTQNDNYIPIEIILTTGEKLPGFHRNWHCKGNNYLVEFMDVTEATFYRASNTSWRKIMMLKDGTQKTCYHGSNLFYYWSKRPEKPHSTPDRTVPLKDIDKVIFGLKK